MSRPDRQRIGHVPVKPCLRSLRPLLVALRRLLTEVRQRAHVLSSEICSWDMHYSVGLAAAFFARTLGGRPCLPACLQSCSLHPVLQHTVWLSGDSLARFCKHLAFRCSRGVVHAVQTTSLLHQGGL